MQIFKKNLSKKTKIQLAVAIAVVLAICVYLVWDITAKGPLTQLFSNTDALRAWVESQGPWGPLAFILIQYIQTVIAPIPGNVSGVLGGMIFGWWGILWSFIGSFFGYWTIYVLTRRFGRTLVEKVVAKKTLDKFDIIFSKRGPIILFCIFVLPMMPDDVVCYIAGLTNIPMGKLMAITTIGRFPPLVINNVIGSGLGDGNYTFVIIFTVALAAVMALVYTQQERIFALLNRAAKQESKIRRQNQQIKELEYKIEDLADDGKLNDSAKKS